MKSTAYTTLAFSAQFSEHTKGNGEEVLIRDYRYQTLNQACINTSLRLLDEQFDEDKRLPVISSGLVRTELLVSDEVFRLSGWTHYEQQFMLIDNRNHFTTAYGELLCAGCRCGDGTSGLIGRSAP